MIILIVMITGGEHTLAFERAALAIVGGAGVKWVMVESIECGVDARRREDEERIIRKAIQPVVHFRISNPNFEVILYPTL